MLAKGTKTKAERSREGPKEEKLLGKKQKSKGGSRKLKKIFRKWTEGNQYKICNINLTQGQISQYSLPVGIGIYKKKAASNSLRPVE